MEQIANTYVPLDRENAMRTEITLFEKPVERIRETCDLMGIAGDFERRLSALETYLEGLVADGETDENRLIVRGLCFLKGNIDRPASQDNSRCLPEL